MNSSMLFGEKIPFSTYFFPIKNELELQVIEDYIKNDPEYKSFLINHMRQMEAYTIVEFIMKTMTMLIDDKVLLKYTVLNSNCSKKKDFLELNICFIIYQALNQKFRSGPEDHDMCCNAFAKKIKAHISQAAYRISKQRSKYIV